MNTLKDFYQKVRPWGFWKPVHDQVVAENPSFVRNKNFKIDMLNVGVGIIWQTSLVMLPIYFVLHKFGAMSVVLLIAAVTTTLLKFTWWDKLEHQDN